MLLVSVSSTLSVLQLSGVVHLLELRMQVEPSPQDPGGPFGCPSIGSQGESWAPHLASPIGGSPVPQGTSLRLHGGLRRALGQGPWTGEKQSSGDRAAGPLTTPESQGAPANPARGQPTQVGGKSETSPNANERSVCTCAGHGGHTWSARWPAVRRQAGHPPL